MFVYVAFNPSIAPLTTNNHLSLYDMPPICFGLSMANIRDISNAGIY
jgi:hypothetical protein